MVVIEEEINGSVINIKVSEKKNYHTYGKEEAIQDLIASVGEDGVSNEQYIEYCELKGFSTAKKRRTYRSD